MFFTNGFKYIRKTCCILEFNTFTFNLVVLIKPQLSKFPFPFNLRKKILEPRIYEYDKSLS